MRNYPVVLLNTVLSPFSFLLIITLASRGALFGEAIEGGLVMTMFSAGTSLQADLSHLKNDFKLQDVVVATPTSAFVYVSGMTLSELIYASPALVLLSALFVVYVHTTLLGLAAIVGVMMLMFLSSVSLGFLLATISSDIVQSYAFSRLFTTLFSTIPPVYYPITYIPLPFRYLAYLSPTTYASEIAQNAAGLLSQSELDLALAWLILAATTAVFFVITVKKSRWRDR
ncbi:MAG: ABC transporter permease [Nitrososphaerota archaeon]|nr:ABC transporter permease [Nitrososphaerota archaeon]